MTKGFVIMAQNTDTVDYVSCAEVLEHSIKLVMPDANVKIIKTTDLPYGDQAPDSNWKLSNDWQVYDASPFDYTIKLEADMIVTRSMDHWWDILANNDVVVASTIRNVSNNVSNVNFYRKFIIDNNLPNVYNAITYFNKSETSKQFFSIVRSVFENWEEFKAILKCNANEKATTDWAYAIACHIIGIEKTTLPAFTEMSMVHMKQFINDIPIDDWTKYFAVEYVDNTLRIGSNVQRYPFHYHNKHFGTTMKEYYGI